MKSLIFSSVFMAFSAAASASTPQAIVSKIQNDGLVSGNTYRVYIQLEDVNSSLHAVWGDVEHPITIESTAPFFQNQYCGYSSRNMHDAIVDLEPSAQFDSYITLGYENANENTLWDVGVDFTSFNDGGEILANNGAWFLLPTDQKCAPSENNLVFIGQFTTEGVLSGTINLQGKDANGEVWRALDVTFTSENAQVFGCTNANASNYNVEATFDDGSCEEQNVAEVVASVTTIENATANDWTVFPNPVRDQLIHIQFNSNSASDQRYVLDIYDLTGKKIASHVLNSGNWIAGNRVTIQQELAAGTYKISLVGNGEVTSQTLVVAK